MRTVDTNKLIVQKVIFEKTGFQVRLFCHKNESDEFIRLQTQRKEGAPEPVRQMREYPSSTEPEEHLEPVEPPEPAEDDSLQIPILKKIIEVFDGEIVSPK
jgi:hypothetical protein